MRKARFAIPVIALGGLAIGSFSTTRSEDSRVRTYQMPWAASRIGSCTS
jgi:hypothetical protein